LLGIMLSLLWLSATMHGFGKIEKAVLNSSAGRGATRPNEL